MNRGILQALLFDRSIRLNSWSRTCYFVTTNPRHSWPVQLIFWVPGRVTSLFDIWPETGLFYKDVFLKQRTQADYADMFARACWIYSIKDIGNKQAARAMAILRAKLPSDVCAKIESQITDVNVRREYMKARLAVRDIKP